MSFVNNNKPTYFSTKLRFAFSGSCMMFFFDEFVDEKNVFGI